MKLETTHDSNKILKQKILTVWWPNVDIDKSNTIIIYHLLGLSLGGNRLSINYSVCNEMKWDE